MPTSRILELESRDPQLDRRTRMWADGTAANRATLALGTVVLATALTLIGAPAAEALGLI